ncbi:transporter substrate-binding domain-containing protein [Lachnospiraceae bacterium LCP25S3_G4]
MKKKVLSILLVLTCVLSMTACGSKKEEASASGDKKESTSISGPDDLEGKKIGVQLGTTGDIYTSDDFGDENIERYNKGFEAVQALSQGKIDAVVIDDQPAKEFVKESDDLQILDAAYAEEDYAMCFKKDSELVDKVNGAIKELKANGTFDAIVDYYIGGKEDAKRYESPVDTDRSNGKLVMATNAEFPPYEYYEGDEVVGIDADFAQAIADQLGMDLKIEDMAFDSIIPAVQSGKADFGAAGMTVTDERKTQVDFADSYYTGRQVIIVKK